MSYGVRLLAAIAAYLALPSAALWLVRTGWIWAGLAVALLNLVGQLALLLAFSTFPLPARPTTLRRMDFAALAWLPHVAVTRLTERGLQGRSRAQLVGRVLLATVLLLGSSGSVAVAILWDVGLASPTAWCACLVVLASALLLLACIGRELGAARGRLDRGTDIG